MKNLITLLLCFTFSAGYAQIQYGIKGGLNLSNIHKSNNAATTNLAGFNAGITTRIYLEDKLNLRPEMVISNKGYSALMVPFGTTHNKLTYLSIPVLAEFSPADRFYLELGPEFNFLMGARMKNNTITIKTNNSYQSFDLALAGGGSYYLGKNIYLEARYLLGVTPIEKNTSPNQKSLNRTFQINLNYLISR